MAVEQLRNSSAWILIKIVRSINFSWDDHVAWVIAVYILDVF